MQQQLHSMKAEMTQYKQTLDHERAEHAEEVRVETTCGVCVCVCVCV